MTTISEETTLPEDTEQGAARPQEINKSTGIRSMAIEEEMKRSYLDYAMSVIVSRALPDVRDGLKPVHRRILFAMKESGNDYNRAHRKSARTVGEVMGKYHPHGDMAIYDAMVRLAQDFSLRVPLVDGQGNFGSMDGDPAAASRYTEARLSKAAHSLLDDIDRDTVDFQPNYDESTQEPKVLPARFPNLLVNGAGGIAVGMATNIPTHNLAEVIDGCFVLMDQPEVPVEVLMQSIPGPDFPTGGIIMGRGGILDAYRTGRGSVVIRGKTNIEEIRAGRYAIIITEIPFQVNKSRMIERIAELVKDKIIEGISDLRDESSREGVRVVIELKRDAVADVVLNQLYRHSQLQTSFGVNMLMLNHGRPEQMNLKQILQAFLEFREEVITRRIRYELKKARDKAHIFLGLAIAIAHIDEVVSLIRTASDRAKGKAELMGRVWLAETIKAIVLLIEPDYEWGPNNTYILSDVQAQAILDLRLHRFTGLERDQIEEELKELASQISNYLSILASRTRILEILRNELLEMKELFGTPRCTSIEDNGAMVDMEDLIQREDMVVTVSMNGYIKRVPLSTYRSQKRGGKGRSGMSTREEDVVSDIFVANTHSPVLFFSNLGKVYQLKAYRLPQGGPADKGRPMINLLPLSPGETISTVMILPDEALQMHQEKPLYMIFATSHGHVRRNRVTDFLNIKINGKIAIKLDEGESLIEVKICTDDDDVMINSYQGRCVRFHVDQVRIFAGRDSNGVRTLRLSPEDHIISMSVLNRIDATPAEREAYTKMARLLLLEDTGEIAEEGAEHATSEADEISDSTDETETTDTPEGSEDSSDSLENQAPVTLSPERFEEMKEKEQLFLVVSDKGYGKRVSSYAYRTTGRITKGFIAFPVSEQIGGVVASFPVEDGDEIILVTDKGKLIRCPIKGIRQTRRMSHGVRIFRIGNDEKIVAVTRVPGSAEDDVDEMMENNPENDTSIEATNTENAGNDGVGVPPTE